MTSRRGRKDKDDGGILGFFRRLFQLGEPLKPPEPKAPPPRRPRRKPPRRRRFRKFLRRLLKPPPPERPPEPLPLPPPPLPEPPLPLDRRALPEGIGVVPEKPRPPKRRLRPAELPEYEGLPEWMEDAINDITLTVEMAHEIDDRGFPPFDEWQLLELHHGPNKSDPWEGILTFEDGSSETFDWGDDWIEAWDWYHLAEYLDGVEAKYDDEY